MDYSKDELREFERLVDMASSRDQMERIEARLGQREFVAKHGKEKCDAMWAEIQREK